VEQLKRLKLLGQVEQLKDITGTLASGMNRPQEADRNYAELRRTLLRTPELQAVLPKFLSECHTLDDFWSLTHTHFPYLTQGAQRRDWLRRQFLSVLDALENDRLPVQSATGGQQFFAPGTQHDGFVAIRELIVSVKQSILVADNFVDLTLWPMLANVPSGAAVRILTKKFPADFATEASKFAKQYSMTVDVRRTDTYTIDLYFVIANDVGIWVRRSRTSVQRRHSFQKLLVRQSFQQVQSQLEAIWKVSSSIT
jgi:hypothetical protein